MKSGFLLLFFLSSSIALVPHSFWNSKGKKCFSSPRSSKCVLSMYFDDCERRGIEEWEAWINKDSDQYSSSWALPRSEEKRKALERHLGYNYDSASNLSVGQVEEETLVWALDTRVVSGGDDEQTSPPCKFRTISDLLVASECLTVADCLAFIWESICELVILDKDNVKEGDSIHMIVFPKSKDLWDYQVIVTMLHAIEICKPLFPSHMDMKIDLFHPNYKNAPKMMSPQAHSPFPTMGIQMLPRKHESEEQDIDDTRDKLKALFDSVDAMPIDFGRIRSRQDLSLENVNLDCRQWLKSANSPISHGPGATIDLIIDMQKEPYHAYTVLWNAIQKLSSTVGVESLVVFPFLDAHTTHRVAVTVNAALRRFNCDMNIEHVFHPDHGKNRHQSPHGMIHIVRNQSANKN